MFFEFGDQITEIEAASLSADKLSCGYVHSADLPPIAEQFGFAASTVENCRYANMNFRSGVEIYRDYTFTELRIVAPSGADGNDDCVALYIRKNLFLVVDVLDLDRSTEQKFTRALHRFAPQSMTLEKLIYAFLDELLGSDIRFIESLGTQVSEMEESILREKPEDDFNQTLLMLKKRLQSMHNYYEQLLDITETVEANENDIFESDTLMYISNLDKRITRLREDVDSLSSDIVHVQDAYSAHLDMKMNKTMKYLTGLSTVFFPLTIIVGWYGMNFQSMPELTWRFGYLYVIGLSAAIIAFFLWISKKKHWM